MALFGCNSAKNYQHVFWKFWGPHPLENGKHRFRLYFENDDGKFVGIWRKAVSNGF